MIFQTPLLLMRKFQFSMKKLQKLSKVNLHTSFLGIMNNRELFTNHGLHRNKLGKKLVNLQLASLLLNTLNKKKSNPISLGWYEKCVEANQPEGLNQGNTCNRNSTHNRKMELMVRLNYYLNHIFRINIKEFKSLTHILIQTQFQNGLK